MDYKEFILTKAQVLLMNDIYSQLVSNIYF